MHSLLKFAVFGTVTLTLGACGFSHSKSQNLPVDSEALLRESVGYDEVNKYVFSQSCVSCHNSATATGGVNLDNYTSVKAQIGEVQQQAIFTRNMPLPPLGLTPFQIQLLSNWIAEGAPEYASTNGGSTQNPNQTPTPVPTPDASQVIAVIRANFDAYVKPLVKKACMDCHDATATPEGFGKLPIIRRIEWRHIWNASHALDFGLVFPNWSTNSDDPVYYLSQLKGVLENGTMPPKDYRIPHQILHDGKLLNAEETQIVLNWVDQSMNLLAGVITTPPTPQQYFASRCLGCHNTSIQSGGFAFQQNNGVLSLPTGNASNGIPFYTPFSPEKSALYLVLLPDASKREGLPQMPYGGSATDAEQQLIYNWIQQGQ